LQIVGFSVIAHRHARGGGWYVPEARFGVNALRVEQRAKQCGECVVEFMTTDSVHGEPPSGSVAMMPTSLRIVKWWLRVLFATGVSKAPHAMAAGALHSWRSSST